MENGYEPTEVAAGVPLKTPLTNVTPVGSAPVSVSVSVVPSPPVAVKAGGA